jgi:hypothetical protein
METSVNAFVCSIDYTSDEIRFDTLPVVDGFLQDGDTNPSLRELEEDGYSTAIAVTDEPDSPELREELEGILRRRFDFLKVPTHESGYLEGRKPQ